MNTSAARVTWLLSVIGGATAMLCVVSLGTQGLVAFTVLALGAWRLEHRALAAAGALVGAGLLLTSLYALAEMRCAAFNTATSSCTSYGGSTALLVGVVVIAIGVVLTVRSRQAPTDVGRARRG